MILRNYRSDIQPKKVDRGWHSWSVSVRNNSPPSWVSWDWNLHFYLSVLSITSIWDGVFQPKKVDRGCHCLVGGRGATHRVEPQNAFIICCSLQSHGIAFSCKSPPRLDFSISICQFKVLGVASIWEVNRVCHHLVGMRLESLPNAFIIFCSLHSHEIALSCELL